MRPESVGLEQVKLVMGKLSGRHTFRQRLEELGYKLSEEEVNHAFERFKRLADQKREIYEEDLEVIISEEVAKMSERVVLKSFHVESGTNKTPSHGRTGDRWKAGLSHSGTGDGPVDAVYRTIAAMTQTKSTLLMFGVNAITGGTDAQGEVSVRLEEDGRTVSGHGADTDIITAAARAYLNALNKLAYFAAKAGGRGSEGQLDLIPTCKVDSSVRSVRVYRSDGRPACAPDSIKEPCVRHASEALP